VYDEFMYESEIPEYLEPHFNQISEVVGLNGLVTLGPLTSASFLQDPRSLLFRAARYKFVSKMVSKTESVLEIGCGDASMSPIVFQSSKSLTCIDLDPLMIKHAIQNVQLHFPIEFKQMNIFSESFGVKFDTIFSLDVLEHVPHELESEFIEGGIKNLQPNGKYIVGTPSLASQEFTTEANKFGHVNCKSPETLVETLQKHFNTILTFGMNDEVLHTGFGPFRNYLFAVCSNPKI
jgi:2-polyprenyl-3-methyl-5-hydroxy-6-metoxy-1,4-benzoquinol methylase